MCRINQSWYLNVWRKRKHLMYQSLCVMWWDPVQEQVVESSMCIDTWGGKSMPARSSYKKKVKRLVLLTWYLKFSCFKHQSVTVINNCFSRTRPYYSRNSSIDLVVGILLVVDLLHQDLLYFNFLFKYFQFGFLYFLGILVIKAVLIL